MMPITDTIARIRVAGNALTPSSVAFELAAVGDYSATLFESERKLIEAWAVHRQHEFATGRFCVRQALAQVSGDGADLLPDIDGVPLWPTGCVGSISHSRGVAMAVAAQSLECGLLGLDLEKTNRLSVAAIQRVVHPQEVNFVAGDQLRASVLFSLKEAFYKAQFPRWRTTGNFHDLALAVDLELGLAEVGTMDSRFAPELAHLQFAFCLVDDYVVSLCWM